MEAFNPRMPILLYHDVSSSVRPRRGRRHTAPGYDLPATAFETHLKLLSAHGFKTLSLHNALEATREGSYVILTFDDGFKGTFDHAAPLLSEFGFQATVFVSTEAVGQPRFMTWTDLQELNRQGIAVQSHGVTHRPLETLRPGELRQELRDSKRCIEDQIGSEVTAMSFPHGSYNQQVVTVAAEEGYHVLCTSDPRPTYLRCFQAKPAVLGRIAVTGRMSTKKLGRLLTFHRGQWIRIRAWKGTTRTIRRLVGVNRYRRLYRYVLGITPPQEEPTNRDLE